MNTFFYSEKQSKIGGICILIIDKEKEILYTEVQSVDKPQSNWEDAIIVYKLKSDEFKTKRLTYGIFEEINYEMHRM